MNELNYFLRDKYLKKFIRNVHVISKCKKNNFAKNIFFQIFFNKTLDIKREKEGREIFFSPSNYIYTATVCVGFISRFRDDNTGWKSKTNLTKLIIANQ